MDFTEDVRGKPTPVGLPLLHKELKGLDRKQQCNNRSAVGMAVYIKGSTIPDISMAVHQCDRFNKRPMLSHEKAIKRISKYLKSTKDRDIVYNPDHEVVIGCYVGAGFAGGWGKYDAENPENVMSSTGFAIFYAGCPVLWQIKLQTEIALSTAEAEYIALSSAMREVIPFMYPIEELFTLF